MEMHIGGEEDLMITRLFYEQIKFCHQVLKSRVYLYYSFSGIPLYCTYLFDCVELTRVFKITFTILHDIFFLREQTGIGN